MNKTRILKCIQKEDIPQEDKNELYKFCKKILKQYPSKKIRSEIIDEQLIQDRQGFDPKGWIKAELKEQKQAQEEDILKPIAKMYKRELPNPNCFPVLAWGRNGFVVQRIE